MASAFTQPRVSSHVGLPADRCNSFGALVPSLRCTVGISGSHKPYKRDCVMHYYGTGGRFIDSLHRRDAWTGDCLCHRLILTDHNSILFHQHVSDVAEGPLIIQVTEDLRPSVVKFASMYVQSQILRNLLLKGVLRVGVNLKQWYDCVLASRALRGDEKQLMWFMAGGTFLLRNLQSAQPDVQELNLRPLLPLLFNDNYDLERLKSWVESEPGLFPTVGLSGIICVPYSDKQPAVHFVAMLAPTASDDTVKVMPIQTTTGPEPTVDWTQWLEFSNSLGTNAIVFSTPGNELQHCEAQPVPADNTEPPVQYALTRSS